MKIVWQSPSLEKEFLKDLQRKSQLHPAIHLLMRLALQVFLGVLLYKSISSSRFELVFVFSLLFGFSYSFMSWAGAGHEYFHSTAFLSSRINKFLFRIFSCATWNNWGWFEISHWLHHKFTLHSSDPEGPPKTSLKKINILWLLTIDIPTLFRRLKILIQNSLNRFPIQNLEIREIVFQRGSAKKRIRIGATSVILFQFILFIVLSNFSFLFAAIVAISPFICTLPNRVLEICQHLGMELHSDDFRRNTRTIRLNRFWEFLYSNMNYHVEHHMFPGIPYYKLPALHQQLRKLNYVSTSKSGFIYASKTAFTENKFVNAEGSPCLTCKTNCPVKPLALD